MSTRRPVNMAFIAATAILLVCAMAMGTAIRFFNLHLQKKPIYPETGLTLKIISSETPHWKRAGVDKEMSAEVLDVLGTDNFISRVYIEKKPLDPDRRQVVELHCAYYTGMIDTVPHVPERCFLGAGLMIGNAAQTLPLNLDNTLWTPDEYVPDARRGEIYKTRLPSFSKYFGQKVRLPREPGDMKLRISEFVDQEGNAGQYSGYFFIANGGTVASAEKVRLLAFNLTDDYAFYLKVQFTSQTVRSYEELRDVAASLLNELLPEIMLCVPDWVDVETGRYPKDNPRGEGPAQSDE